MAYDVKKTDHLFIPFSRNGSALRDSKNNTKIYKDMKTLMQHNKKSQDEPAWLTHNYYIDVVEYAPVVHGFTSIAEKPERVLLDRKCGICDQLMLATDNYCPMCGAKNHGENI